MVEVLLAKPMHWLSGNGPEAAQVVRTRGALVRNLADFPFAHQCSEDEKRAIEERVLGVLDSLGLLASGQYISMSNLDARECRFLVERQLVTDTLVRGAGPRGVYIRDDQSLSLMVNEGEHIRMQAFLPGLQIQECWQRLNELDDRLAGALDYAFDDRLGYLTSDVGRLGTGLRLDAILHLPALLMQGRILNTEQTVRDQHHLLEGTHGSLTDARGDLCTLENRRTLGRSEDEIVFHMKHIAGDLLVQEKAAHDALAGENPRTLEDRVGRALGVVRGARLLEYGEALALLSSLRLGLASGFASGYTYQQLNQLLVAAQRAHIEMHLGRDCDDYTLSMERADLFRKRFS